MPSTGEGGKAPCLWSKTHKLDGACPRPVRAVLSDTGVRNVAGGWQLMHAFKFIRKSILFSVAGMMLVSAMAMAARHGHAGRKGEPGPLMPLNEIRVYGNRPAPFALAAKSAELMAVHSGAVLYAYNQHLKMQPASLANMMTFYLALE